MANRIKLTEEKINLFLEFFACSGNVSQAAKLTGLSRQAFYIRRAKDEAFARAWDAAYEQATDLLEDEAVRRILEGVEEPVFYQGSQCGSVRKFSDTLLMFLLKARRPDKFKERAGEGGREGGGAQVVEVRIANEAGEMV